MAVELFFILFFGLGRLLDPENKIKKAGTDSPTRSCEEERRSKQGARPNFYFENNTNICFGANVFCM
jgi:hypothetical protein